MVRQALWTVLFLFLSSTYATAEITVERPDKGWDYPSIDVTTGPMKFSVRLSADGYLGRVWIDENGDGRFDMFEVISNPQAVPSLYLRVIRPTDSSGYRPGMWRIDGGETAYWGRADSIWVTEKPGEATVHSRGRFGFSDRWPYSLSLTARDGSTAIEVKLRFNFRGDPSGDFISALGAITGFDYTDIETYVMGRYAFGAHDRVRQTLVNEARWNNVASGHRYSTSRRGMDQSVGQLRYRIYEYGLSLGLEEWDLPMPDWNLASMIQYTPRNYKIWKAIGTDVGNLPVHFGKECRGWVDVSDTTRGMAIVLREMAVNSPKALSVDMGKWDPGAFVKVELWPDQVPPLDLRPTSGDDFGIESPGVKERLELSGIERTFEWMVYFHQGDFKVGRVEETATAFLETGRKGGDGR